MPLLRATQTHDLPVVYSKNSGVLEDVGKLAPAKPV
jgi:hypothetical protein